MAWNEPGNNDNNGRDPWKNAGKNSSSSDLEKYLNNLKDRLLAFLPKSKTGSGRSVSPSGSTGLLVFAIIAVVIWIGSGFYTIDEAERGVVLRFGKYSETVNPGLRWKMTFIDKVVPVDVESVKSTASSGFMLTKDQNLVRVEMDVQYRVDSSRKYLFSVNDADNSLREATDSALRYVVGHTTMDDLLTTGREKVRQQTWQVLEEIIKPYDMGLAIVDVNFLPARPPEEVKDAFDDAIAAQEDEQRFIREAEAYARETEPRARGQAKRMEEESLGYKDQVVLKATGDVARFNALLPEYQAAPQLTRQRIFMDTMEDIYKNNPKILIDLPKDSHNVIYLPFDKLNAMQKSAAGSSVKSANSSSSATTGAGTSSSTDTSSSSADDSVTTPTETTTSSTSDGSQPLRSNEQTSGRY
jgi:membrane protease subunit HflK